MAERTDSTAAPSAQAGPSLPSASSLCIDRRRDALLVIDLQPDFMPGGSLAVADGDAVVAPIAALVLGRGFDTIVATQDWHPSGHISFASRHGLPPFSTLRLHRQIGGQAAGQVGGHPGVDQTLWPDHCVQGTPGAALHAGLPRDPLTLILRKGTYADADSYSAFRENQGPRGVRRTTGLGALLRARSIERVFVCGLARDYCVAWTAIDAMSEGLSAFVMDDLCRAVNPDGAAATDAAFLAAGVRTIQSSQLVFPADSPAAVSTASEIA